MSHPYMRFFWLILLSFILTIMPLPFGLSMIRPPWILWLLLYVTWFMPSYLSMGLVVLLGILLDVMLASVMGEHAFALVLTIWLASTKSRRFHLFNMSQQMALFGILVACYEVLLDIIDLMLGFSPNFNYIIPVALISAALWPWYILFLRGRYKLQKGVRF